MRKTEAGRHSLISPEALTRSLRLAACVLGIGLCLATHTARAGDDDDEDDNTPIEDRIMKNIIGGLGGTNMDNKGINYRERSPLVVPRNLDLPPPADAKAVATPPNWPKDPTIAAQKASAEAAKRAKPDMFEMSRTLTPAELAPKRTRSARSAEVQQPGSTPDAYGGTGTGPMLNPGQLGFSNSMFSSVFKGNSTEIGQFKGEPTRESLTQPPVGYQTPSPSYAYGTGQVGKPIDQQAPNPLDPNSAVKKDN